jgi:hypothetical protein
VRRVLFVVLSFFIMAAAAYAENDPLVKLADDTVSYFKPVTGTITHAEGKTVTLSIGEKGLLKTGMRLKVMRQGAPFIHPVTKEMLGRIESTVGRVEVKGVEAGAATAVVVEGDAKEGDKVRISDTTVRLFFYQDKGVDWYLGDEYYRKLKGSGRMEMVDTALDSADKARVLEEAKKHGADIAIMLTARSSGKDTLLRERLYWIPDGEKFIDKETEIPADYSEGLKVGEQFFMPKAAEAVMKFDLPLGEEFVTMGDVAGDGNQEIVLGTSKSVHFYKLGMELLPLWEIKGSSSDKYLWVDAADLNNDRKDEIIITSMKHGGIVSYIYEFNGAGFTKLWEGKYFLRKLGSGLIAQAYSSSEGFAGDVYKVDWKGSFSLGEKLKLPKGVNIFDFAFVGDASKNGLVFAYDDKGYMNVYDDTGTRIWRSASVTGSFRNTFKKDSVFFAREAGEWSIKDRLIGRRNEVLAVQRVPLVEMARGLGNKSSRIKDFWWNGLSMEEGVLIDRIPGNLLDYSLVGDKIAVLSKSIMGVNFGNILKGERIVGTALYIYETKGR